VFVVVNVVMIVDSFSNESYRAAAIAFFMAKNTEEAKKSGGSPIPKHVEFEILVLC
jgi:hypothetical protein